MNKRRESQLGMILAISSILAGESYAHVEDHYIPKRKKPTEKIIPPIPKGHKKFIIEGKDVWALNYRNAVKRFKKGKI